MNDELFGELHEEEENGLYGNRHLNELNGATVKLWESCPNKQDCNYYATHDKCELNCSQQLERQDE